MRVRLAALLATLAGLAATAVLLAAPASAHATLVGSDPVDGSRLAKPPSTVTITFDEPVGIGGVGYLHVTDQHGTTVDAGPAFHPNGDGAKVADTLKPGLGNGTYTASFRVVSADSHPVAGAIRFVVGNGPLVGGPTTVSSGSADPVTSDVFDVVRWFSYAGLALLGGAWLVLTVWPAGRDDRRARTLIWTGWTAATVGALVELLVQGPYSAGSGIGQLGSWTLLDATLHGDYGQLHSARLVLLGVVGVIFARSLQSDARPARWEAVTGLLGLGITWTFSDAGHASTTSPSWLSVPLDMAHLLAMATWLGGLALLAIAVIPRREPDELQAVVPMFSRVAFGCVATLAATGTYAAWRGIGSTAAIFGTTYGLIVLGKVVLFVGLLAVGNLSRTLVRRRFGGPTVAYAMTDAVLTEEPAPPPPPADVDAERLRRSVIVETGVALLVLALTAVLVTEPRGREALATKYRQPVTATAPLGRGQDAVVTVDPGVHGRVNLTVDLPGPTVSQITATATEPDRQIGPLPVHLRPDGRHAWSGAANLPVSGSWQIQLTVTMSPLNAVVTRAELTLH